MRERKRKKGKKQIRKGREAIREKKTRALETKTVRSEKRENESNCDKQRGDKRGKKRKMEMHREREETVKRCRWKVIS